MEIKLNAFYGKSPAKVTFDMEKKCFLPELEIAPAGIFFSPSDLSIEDLDTEEKEWLKDLERSFTDPEWSDGGLFYVRGWDLWFQKKMAPVSFHPWKNRGHGADEIVRVSHEDAAAILMEKEDERQGRNRAEAEAEARKRQKQRRLTLDPQREGEGYVYRDGEDMYIFRPSLGGTWIITLIWVYDSQVNAVNLGSSEEGSLEEAQDRKMGLFEEGDPEIYTLSNEVLERVSHLPVKN